MRRITYHQMEPPRSVGLPAEGMPVRDDLREKRAAAQAMGGAVFILVAILGVIGMMVFAEPALRTVGIVLAIATTVGLGTAAWFTLRWAKRVAVRDWTIDDMERSRRHQAEDEDRARRQNLLDALQQGRVQADEERLDHVARAILARHYAGHTTTRTGCVDDGVCNQQEWNTINAAFKALGWRNGRRLDPGLDMETALALWQQDIEYVDGHIRVWTRSDTGKWRCSEV